MERKTVTRRPLKQRGRGVYYTPRELSALLCSWAVRKPTDTILEPSFGGCVFIDCILNALRQHRNRTPERNVFGCDTDRKAFEYLLKTLPNQSALKQFRRTDFLRVKPDMFPRHHFTVVLGNPPYVSHHNMAKCQRATAWRLAVPKGIEVDRKASLWGYFLAHSLNFLSRNGRMAWVLPGSLLHAFYGKRLLHSLSKHFERIAVVSLGGRYFKPQGAKEKTELLLCEGWRRGPAKAGVEIVAVPNLTACQSLLKNWKKQRPNGAALNGEPVRHLLQGRASSLVAKMQRLEGAHRLGEIFDVKIGIVTGDNSFFVLKPSAVRRHRLPASALAPIFSKFAQVGGLFLGIRDLSRAVQTDEPCLLLHSENMKRSKKLRSYLARYPKEQRTKNRTFGKRGCWHRPDLGSRPEAFLSYMNRYAPRIAINKCGLNSTNTIHRLYLKPGYNSKHALLMAISLHSTVGQLSAELEGRIYGSGVLKHEPTEAKRILVFAPPNAPIKSVRRTAKHIDKLLRSGKQYRAQAAADRFLMRYIPGLNSRILAATKAALKQSREDRYPPIKGKEPV